MPKRTASGHTNAEAATPAVGVVELDAQGAEGQGEYDGGVVGGEDEALGQGQDGMRVDAEAGNA